MGVREEEEASLIISTPEALAVLIASKLQFGETPPIQRMADVVTLLRECLAHGDGWC